MSSFLAHVRLCHRRQLLAYERDVVAVDGALKMQALALAQLA
jgi:hypothetical protein